MSKNDLVELIQNTITKFCHDFLLRPYLCYTEHGMHALFFQQLYNVLPKPIVHFEGEDVCILQKEYPTANKLGKSRRQHWDIALIKTPIEMPQRRPRFDYLRLAAVIEFGLNCDSKHLEDDIERLCHPDANVDNGFIVHLYRLSSSKAKFSDWDWSPDSGILCSKEFDTSGSQPARTAHNSVLWDRGYDEQISKGSMGDQQSKYHAFISSISTSLIRSAGRLDELDTAAL